METEYATKGTSLAVDKPTEIERFTKNILEQKDLINTLEHRLNVVSNRDPQPEEKGSGEASHISSLVDELMINNRELRRLLNELVI